MSSDFQLIIGEINQDFQIKTEARDKTLALSRELIRHCANTIRAVHRAEKDLSAELLATADSIAREMSVITQPFPDIYHAGYTQDALKELAEAHLTRALIFGNGLPTPQEINVGSAAYINGLAETVGELRRYALDALRLGKVDVSETMLDLMDEIYTALVTVDFPSAITRDLRRKTDIARSILERTRGDVTTAARQEAMKQALATFETRMAQLEADSSV